MNRELSASKSPSVPGKRNLRAGWWTLLVFVCLGILLEIGLGFRGHFYMDVSQQTRRLMWRLAHAHGTLLALLNIMYGLIAVQSSNGGQQFGGVLRGEADVVAAQTRHRCLRRGQRGAQIVADRRQQ